MKCHQCVWSREYQIEHWKFWKIPISQNLLYICQPKEEGTWNMMRDQFKCLTANTQVIQPKSSTLLIPYPATVHNPQSVTPFILMPISHRSISLSAFYVDLPHQVSQRKLCMYSLSPHSSHSLSPSYHSFHYPNTRDPYKSQTLLLCNILIAYLFQP
jgi:hypothetical protein